MVKSKLTRDKLQQNNISFSRSRFKKGKVGKYLGKYCEQALILYEGLLDFKAILSQSSYERLSVEDQRRLRAKSSQALIPPIEECPDLDLELYQERYQIAQHDARFELAQRVQRKANAVRCGKEPRWSSVVKNELFGYLIESSRHAEGVKIFDPKQIVERIRIEDEDNWAQGKKSLKRTAPLKAPELSRPRPDLYIALPIIKSRTQRGFYRDGYIRNFTIDNLKLLEQEENGNLMSNPLTSLNGRAKLSEKHAVCFPCAVVEIKHHHVSDHEIEYCFCQAANAAAAALSMLVRLSYFSDRLGSFKRIKPVVAFTFIGYRSEVWIAFVSNSKWDDRDQVHYHYEMQCIWRGDLRITWKALQLCRIIENLHYWTVRHFRPWVSSCLDRWCSVIESNDKHSKALKADLIDDDNTRKADYEAWKKEAERLRASGRTVLSEADDESDSSQGGESNEDDYSEYEESQKEYSSSDEGSNDQYSESELESEDAPSPLRNKKTPISIRSKRVSLTP